MLKLTDEQIARNRRHLERGLITQEEFDGMFTGQHLLPIANRTLTFKELLEETGDENTDLSLAEYQAQLEDWYAQSPDHDHLFTEWCYDFMKQIREGDEIRKWNTIGGLTGTVGYVLVRDGQAVDYLTTGRS